MTIKSYQMDIFNQAISIMEREGGGGLPGKFGYWTETAYTSPWKQYHSRLEN